MNHQWRHFFVQENVDVSEDCDVVGQDVDGRGREDVEQLVDESEGRMSQNPTDLSIDSFEFGQNATHQKYSSRIHQMSDLWVHILP